MKYSFTFLILLLSSTLVFGQSSPVSQSMLLRSNWDDDNLPTKSGGFAYNDIWGYAANGREYAILGTIVGTIFIDITDPTNPVEVDRIDGGYTSSLWRDFKTYGTYAYGVADESTPANRSGLQIFDLSDLPNSVTKVYDSNTFFEEAHNIFIDEASGRLYAVGTDTRGNGVIVLDLSVTPDNPTLMASVPLTGGYVHDIFVRSDTAFCSHGFGGFRIYDMTNPATPVNMGALPTYPNQGYNHSSWITDDENYLVFADESRNRPLRVLDISNKNNPSIISTFMSTLERPVATNSIAHNPFIKDDWVFISYYHDGIQVFDISDPLNPTQVAYYDTDHSNADYGGSLGAWGVYPFLPSGLVIGSDIRNGLFVVQPMVAGLSIDATSLEAKALSRGIELTWATTEASPFNSFRVERSADGASFEQIEEVPATMDQESFYVMDPKPLAGKSVYRLQMIDGEGQVHLSNQVEVEYELQGGRIDLYPNPVSAQASLSLRVESETQSQIRIEFSDIRGSQVFRTRIEAAPGVSIHEVAHDLPAGTYFAKIQNGLESRVMKLVVQ